MIVQFDLKTKHQNFSGVPVDVVDPKDTDQLKLGAKKALTSRGYPSNGLLAYRARDAKGGALTPDWVHV